MLREGELTEAVANYRKVMGNKPYFVIHTYSGKRLGQLRARAIASIGLIPQSRYHKG